MKTKKKSKLTNDSSKQIDEHLHRISFREIKILGEILRGLSLKSEQFVQKRFSEGGVHYSDVADFLLNLGFLRRAKGQMSLAETFGEADEDLKASLIQHFLDRGNQYWPHLIKFFRHFKSVETGFEILMDSDKRRKFGGIRNVLLELEFLDHNFKEPRYWIAWQHLPAFFEAISNAATKPSEFRQIIAAREKLGTDAELEIVAYETKRLLNYPHLIKRIQHVALENVSAGFDISSFTIEAESQKSSSRLIEVKAVSFYDFKFFWSRNEIETARTHGHHYFLYLLPVSKNGFEIQKLKIIQDPFKRVYMETESWFRAEESISFWPSASSA